MRRLALALAAGAAVLASTLVFSAPTQAQNDPASRALRYLAGQQHADGSIPSPFPSYSPTEDTVIAASVAGYDPNSFRIAGGQSLVDYLRNAVADASRTAARDGELIQAVVAAHLSAYSFGNHDLVSLLQSPAYYNPATGVYGDGQAFTEALAIQGLRAAGVAVPATALSHLGAAADQDGGWDYLAVPGDPSGSDTNSTAMVLMALNAAGDHSRDRAALGFLHAQQGADGGFAYQAGAGIRSDADSTALVVQSLVSAGEDPTGCGWLVGGATPYTALLSMQDPAGGYAGFGGIDAFTTSQVPAGLLLRPYPAAGVDGPGFVMADEQAAGRRALLYLRSQQSSADGSIASPFPSFGPSENYVIAAAAAGYDPSTLRNGPPSAPSVIDYLRTRAGDASSSPGQTGELIQAVVAARLDPRSFAGRDLAATLQAGYNATSGAYGDGQNFTQALAIQGAVAAGAVLPAGAVSNLLAAENADGGWNYLDARNGAPGSDSNSTAMALMALDAAGHHERDGLALAYLHGLQRSNGGFAFQGLSSDPDSDALVMQALVASLQSPADPAWSQGGNTVVTALIAAQDPSGGYRGSAGVDAFTTAQVPVALERVPFPVRFGNSGAWAAGASLDGAVPGPVAPLQPVAPQGCAAAASPSASPTGGLGPATSAGPTPTIIPSAAAAPGDQPGGSSGGTAVSDTSGDSGNGFAGGVASDVLGSSAEGAAAVPGAAGLDRSASAAADAGAGPPIASGVKGAGSGAPRRGQGGVGGGGTGMQLIYVLAALAAAGAVVGANILVRRIQA